MIMSTLGGPFILTFLNIWLTWLQLKKIQYNPGRGLCLYISTGQQENFDPKKLKKYANKKMIEWFVHVKKSFIYPFNITVGSGNTSYQKPINHPYQFFDFLRSDEAEYAYNTGEPELIILATIINQPITLLMYKLQGLPRDTPLEERCRIEPSIQYNFSCVRISML
jgi:hypothetical protein